MLLNLSQVLGWSDPSATVQGDLDLSNSDSKTKQELKRSRLQDRRAAELSGRNNNTISSYIGSFSFFNLVPNSNVSADSAKKQNDITNLNHLPLSTSTPINLASQCITAQVDKDETLLNVHGKATSSLIDNYNLNFGGKKDPFSKFEKAAYYGIPQKLLNLNNESMVTNMGIFPEIGRAWISADNRLYIWNYNASVTAQEFDVINDFDGTIITCALAQPKPNVFVESVNQLIVVATSKEMHILALQYKPSTSELEVSDTRLSLSIHGLIVNKIIFFEKTKDILFTGLGSGNGVWILDYSSSNAWFSKSIHKKALVESSTGSKTLSLHALLDQSASGTETIIDIKIDHSRNLLYTLSSKSVIRAYKLKLKNNEVTFSAQVRKEKSSLISDISLSQINSKSPLLAAGSKIINIFPVSRTESNGNLYLIAVNSNGCRFYINGTAMGNTFTLTSKFVKFPPLDEKEYKMIEKKVQTLLNKDPSMSVGGMIDIPNSQQDAVSNKNTQLANMSANKSITKPSFSSVINVEEIKNMQESSNLLAETSHSLISSPGIFIGYSKFAGLFTSVPDYGLLKQHSQFVEDFEVHEKGIKNIFGIVQLSPTGVGPRSGNDFAHQYTEEPLEFAVLASTGIIVYRYRTPDLILNDSLNDTTFKQFAFKYGYDEACSTALYLACKYDRSDSFRNLAARYFISGGRSSKLDRSLSPIIDNVEPSDRFFAILLLLSRLISQIWKKNVFSLKPTIKFTAKGYIDPESLNSLGKHPKVMLSGINISKHELDYLLCSILILIKFLEDNKNSIPGFSSDVGSQHETTSWKEKAKEVCIQAEQICFSSIFKFLNVVKEGLSFLAILLEHYDEENKNFQDIISFLPLQLQADLSCLRFDDFFTKSEDDVSILIKEILSCILSKNIADGHSVELVAQTLQEKCGFFCSTDDVLIFKAVECLKKAKSYSSVKDDELKLKSLEGAMKLLKQTSDSLSDDTVADCVNATLQLGYYPEAVEFLLDIANTPEMNKLTSQVQSDLQFSKDLDTTKLNAYHRKLKLYHIIFQILVDIDKKALESVEKASDNTLIGNSHTFNESASVLVDKEGHMMTYYSRLRDECYTICLNYKDQNFHYEFYKWFVTNGVGEKLLYIDTPYILDFLKEHAKSDLEMSKLLWLYYSKKGNYYEAANQLYQLSLSEFDIMLVDRIQFLSIANSFIQVVETQFLKHDIMDLASRIHDLISVSNLQDELLVTILNDSRMGTLAKDTAQNKLNAQILPINYLYNDYIDPLGYYELALLCFKLSDYKNHEDIMSKWESLFQKWFVEYSQNGNKTDNEGFTNELLAKFSALGERLKDIDELFPIKKLLPALFEKVHACQLQFSTGSVVDALLKSGVAYDNIYYSLRKVIETISQEPFEGYREAFKKEMCYLIHQWYQNDKNLRGIIQESLITSLSDYDLNKDPIFAYIKMSGNPL